MTRGAAFLLALGLSTAALLYGGIWEYGDGFIFNRFNGQVIYVQLPDEEEAVQLGVGSPRRRPRLVGREIRSASPASRS